MYSSYISPPVRMLDNLIFGSSNDLKRKALLPEYTDVFSITDTDIHCLSNVF
jgi:hypothetical protein